MNRALVIAVTLGTMALVAGACTSPSPARRFDFSRMRHQARYDTWSADPSSPTGGVMRTPPLHTRARDDTTFADDGRAMEPSASAVVLANGARQYAISCLPCHGAAGFGGGPVSVNLVPWPAPSLRTPRVATMSGQDVYDIVGSGGTRMPALAWQMPSRTRWAVAEWVRRLGELAPHDSALRADSAEAERVAAAMMQWREREALRRGNGRRPGDRR